MCSYKYEETKERHQHRQVVSLAATAPSGASGSTLIHFLIIKKQKSEREWERDARIEMHVYPIDSCMFQHVHMRVDVRVCAFACVCKRVCWFSYDG